MFEIMAGKRPQFGKVRPRERGEGWRIDVRPFGWVITLAGNVMSRELAEELLKAIRVEIARGKPPDDAVAPYLGPRAKPNLVIKRYHDWITYNWQKVDAGDLSPRTVGEYERYGREGGEVAWWRGVGIPEVDSATLEDWSLWMASRGLGPKSRRNVLGAFRSFFSWMKRRKLVARVPDFPFPRAEEHQPKIITPEAQNAVLAAIPEQDRGPLLVAALMGLRPGEVRALSVGDVLRGEDPPLLVVSRAMKGFAPGAPIGPTKNRRQRSLPIPEPVLEWLDTHVPGGDATAPLFLNPRTGRRWSHWALRDRWMAAAKRVGVDAGLYEGTKHAFATDALDRTRNERAVQEYLGHQDARSTRRYAKLSRERLAEVVRPRQLH